MKGPPRNCHATLRTPPTVSPSTSGLVHSRTAPGSTAHANPLETKGPMSGAGPLRAGSSAPSYPSATTRRSIARRSCQLCRHRKTRCELPDPTVPDDPSPLPEARKCHRCKVLGEQCVVFTAGSRAGLIKKRKAGEAELEGQAPLPTSIQHGGGERVELLTTFDPEGHRPSGSGGGPRRHGESSMQYHTRPITVTSAMLRCAFPGNADDSEPEGEANVEGLQAT
jgi:hypothetical protein